MPRASPDATTKPPSPSPAANSRAKRRPFADALRAPTTAIIGCPKSAVWPSTVKTGGASSTAASALG